MVWGTGDCSKYAIVTGKSWLAVLDDQGNEVMRRPVQKLGAKNAGLKFWRWFSKSPICFNRPFKHGIFRKGDWYFRKAVCVDKKLYILHSWGAIEVHHDFLDDKNKWIDIDHNKEKVRCTVMPGSDGDKFCGTDPHDMLVTGDH